MSAPHQDRPRPLQHAAKVWGRVVAGAGGVISALVTAGALTSDQGTAVAGTFTALDGLVVATTVVVSAGSALLTAFGVHRSAEPQVTPVDAPALVVDGELVPLEPAYR
jgi:FtsH-binding integral membrane protein